MITVNVEKILQKAANKLKTLQFGMRVPELGVDYAFSSTTPNQRFHSASVGKLCTAVLIFQAIEQGFIALDTPVRSILDEGMLDGLYVYGGKDYQSEVTVEHLLGHTSGIQDYFEGKTLDGTSFIREVIRQPEKIWTPKELIDYTRTKQQAVGAPGQKYLYSDTGYILLGLIIESHFGMPFADALRERIFKPAGMTDTCLCFYSDDFDSQLLAPLYIKGVDLRYSNALSCDFSGGGLSTTISDLLRFLDHLQHFRLISEQSAAKMARFEHRFHNGMIYGLGMMQLRFEQLFFLLRNMPRLQGHLGVTGVHAWYDPATQASYVLNVGNVKDMSKSFRLLIQILQIVQRGQRS